MRNRTPKQSMLRVATLSLFAASLVACGGDGGDNPAPFTGPLDVTAANSDTLSHATAAALFAFGSTSDAIPTSADAGPTAQVSSLVTLPASGEISTTGWLPPRLVDVLMRAGLAGRESSAARRAQALAVSTSPPEDCTISGSSTTSIEDRDNNGALSLGDLVTVAFDNCQDSRSEVINGSATVSITRIGPTVLLSFGASMSVTQLSQQAMDGRHGLAVTGNFNLDYEQMSSTIGRARLVANGPVTIAARPHQGFDDTVTLQSGFEWLSDHDTSTGLTRNNATGMLQSPTAGAGVVVVSTPQTIEVADAERYPRSGSVKMAGQGSVVLNALPNNAVQINLDADGDGSYESSKMENWDWLF
jgi:hypothetical protein